MEDLSDNMRLLTGDLRTWNGHCFGGAFQNRGFFGEFLSAVIKMQSLVYCVHSWLRK